MGGLYIKPNLQRHLFMLMFLQKNDLPAEIILIPLLLILSISYKTESFPKRSPFFHAKRTRLPFDRQPVFSVMSCSGVRLYSLAQHIAQNMLGTAMIGISLAVLPVTEVSYAYKMNNIFIILMTLQQPEQLNTSFQVSRKNRAGRHSRLPAITIHLPYV